MAKKKSINYQLNAGSFLISEAAIHEFHKETGINRVVTRLLLSIHAVSITSGNDIVASGNVRKLIDTVTPFNNNAYTSGLLEMHKRGLIERSIHYYKGNIKRLYICLTGLGIKMVKRFSQLLCEMTDKVVLFNA